MPTTAEFYDDDQQPKARFLIIKALKKEIHVNSILDGSLVHTRDAGTVAHEIHVLVREKISRFQKKSPSTFTFSFLHFILI
jgi:hypothetical protein